MTMFRFCVLSCLLLAPVATAGPVQAQEAVSGEKQKIESLIKHIESLDRAVFIRNGREHDAGAAARFMRLKWKQNAAAIRTVADFIERAASFSSTTGRDYLIRLADGREVKSRDYLL